MKLTKEQIIECLNRLRVYAYLNYYVDESFDFFNKSYTLKNSGKEVKVEILKDGRYKLIKDDEFAIYSCLAVTAPIRHGVENVEYKIHCDQCIGNQEYFDHFQIFLMSAFQRANAFIFLGRMQDVSIEEYASRLVLIEEKDNSEEDIITKN